MSTPPLARRERHALCDLALAVGPDAPTLCEGWTSSDLVAHLYVREHRPTAAAGMFVPALAGRTDAAMRRALHDGYAALTTRLRDPGRLTVFSLRPVELLANTLEYVVHHEDLRRGGEEWSPRPDSAWAAGDLDTVWRHLGRMGRGLVRPAGVPVRLVRSDTGAHHDLGGSGDPVVVTGPVVEVTLLLFGRDRVRDVEVTGPDEAVASFRAAGLGI